MERACARRRHEYRKAAAKRFTAPSTRARRNLWQRHHGLPIDGTCADVDLRQTPPQSEMGRNEGTEPGLDVGDEKERTNRARGGSPREGCGGGSQARRDAGSAPARAPADARPALLIVRRQAVRPFRSNGQRHFSCACGFGAWVGGGADGPRTTTGLPSLEFRRGLGLIAVKQVSPTGMRSPLASSRANFSALNRPRSCGCRRREIRRNR